MIFNEVLFLSASRTSVSIAGFQHQLKKCVNRFSPFYCRGYGMYTLNIRVIWLNLLTPDIQDHRTTQITSGGDLHQNLLIL